MMTNHGNRLTQGQFSYLPDLTDKQISAQIEYALSKNWALGVEYSDDPHPRNTYWEMYGNPMFDLKDASAILTEVNACRKTFPNHYIRVTAFDATQGVESVQMSYIVNRPKKEPGFGLTRQEIGGRQIQYTVQSYATDKPEGDRYYARPDCDKAMSNSSIPGVRAETSVTTAAQTLDATAPALSQARSVGEVLAQSQVEEVLAELDRDLVGLAPVKNRIRDIAALLVIDKLRTNLGLVSEAPSLHMNFVGNPGTGKTSVAMRMAQILHRLGYVRKGHLVAVTRDDLVGQYIGHTAPKTKEVLKKAMGGVLFIDEAYYLYRPENERDYGQEAIEILLQVMENQRDDLVVILAGYKDRMDTFFESNPGMSSRIAHHIDFPDYSVDELLQISQKMLVQQNYVFAPDADTVFQRYLGLRVQQPHFANARSVRNALDRARLRQASRLFADRDRQLSADDLRTLTASDFAASRVFQQADVRSDE